MCGKNNHKTIKRHQTNIVLEARGYVDRVPRVAIRKVINIPQNIKHVVFEALGYVDRFLLVYQFYVITFINIDFR